jgi:predicted transcriptional regulator of viral defense system
MYNASRFFASHPVLTGGDFTASFPARSTKAKQSLLDYHVGTGTIIRIRRNLFAAVPIGSDPEKFQVNPYLVAAKLADDSVISHHSAIAYYGLAQSIRHTVLFTTKNKDIEEFDFQDNTYRSVLTKKALIVHQQEDMLVSTVDCQGLQIKVTANERSLVDCLDRLDLSGGAEELWRSLEGLPYVNAKKLVDYAILIGNASLIAKVGFYLDTNKDRLMISSKHLAKLQELRPKNACYMFRSHRTGRLVKPWNLIVPESIIERNWEEAS